MSWAPGKPLGVPLRELIAGTFGLQAPYVIGGVFLGVVAFLILPVVNDRTIRVALEYRV